MVVRAPAHDAATLWPSERIAAELVRHGLGAEVLSIVKRLKAVPKSASAAPGERTTIERHIETLGLDSLLVGPPKRITIVDDVVTKGRMLLAPPRILPRGFPRRSCARSRWFARWGSSPRSRRSLSRAWERSGIDTTTRTGRRRF